LEMNRSVAIVTGASETGSTAILHSSNSQKPMSA
jgi:hypothetical protein